MATLKDRIAAADEELLAGLGYKQEFHRAFTPLEVRLLTSFPQAHELSFRTHSRSLELLSVSLDSFLLLREFHPHARP